MPFGISLAPEVFEGTLQECLTDLRGVKVIRDDILVVGYGATDAEAQSDHEENRGQVYGPCNREIKQWTFSGRRRLRPEVKLCIMQHCA